MENRENDADGFVSAADFFRQQHPPPVACGGGKDDLVQRKPPRESLLVVARNSQVKNKISTFDRQHQHQHGGSSGAPAFSRPAAPPPGRPAGGAGLRPAAGPPLPRRTAAAPALGAIAEEAASLAAGRAPPRRHAAVVSTVTGAPARRHVALVGTNTPAPPPPVALPSPGTKQQVAEKQHQARFPSIMFHPPQPAAPARAPLPGGVAVLPPGPAPAAVQQQQQAWQDEVTPQPRPLPAVLAPVLRSSLSPPQRQPQWQHEEEAAVPAPAVNAPLAAAAAVPAGTDSEEEHFVDADSGGAPSNEGSGVWADAREAALPHPAAVGNVVIEDEEGGSDAASVASDASTVVPDREHDQMLGDDEQQGRRWVEEAGDEPAALPDPAAAAAPEPELCDSPLLAGEAAGQQGAAPRLAAGPTAASDVFQSACSQLPALDGSLEGPLFGCPPPRRTSLSPALSGGSRRSSLAGAPLAGAGAAAGEVESLRDSLTSGIAHAAAEEAALAAAVAAAAFGEQQEHQQQAPSSPPAPKPEAQPARSASVGVPATAAVADAAAGEVVEGGGGLAPLSEASRASVASNSSATAAPSLNIEFSEASLRYSAERLFQEQPAAAEAALPPAAAATPQQLRLSLQGAASPAAPANTPASPRLGGAATGGLLAPGRHSLPVGASAVAEAIEQAATASTDGASEAGTEAVGRRASAAAAQPAPADAEGRRVSLAEAAAAYSPAAASPAVVAAPMVAPSPVPATPYAATEYDGEDVVMMDIDFTPRPTTGRRALPGSSRFQLEAHTSASHTQAGAGLAPAAPADGRAPTPAAARQPSLPSPSMAEENEAVAELQEQAPAAVEAAPSAEEAEQPGAAVQQDIAPAEEEPVQPAAEQGSNSGDTAPILPQLPVHDAAARRGRAGRLSMPANWQAAGGADRGSRASRLSLPSGMVGGEEALAFAPRPKLASSPLHGAAPAAEPAPQPETQEATQQAEAQQQQAAQQEQAAQEEQAAGQLAAAAEKEADGGADVEPPQFAGRARLAAEDAELPADIGAIAAEEQPVAFQTALAAEQPPTAADAQAPAAGAAAEQAAAPSVGQQPAEAAELGLAGGKEEEEEALAAAAFAAKPKLAMSPALSSGPAQSVRSSLSGAPRSRRASDASSGACGSLPGAADDRRGSHLAAAVPDLAVAAVFAARPVSAISPAGSSGSVGRSPAAAEEEQRQQEEQGEQQQGADTAVQDRAGQPAGRLPSPAMSSNPLAGAGDTPAAASSQRVGHSPAPSGLSAGALSNNPMYAGTPSHPTPPSVNLKSFSGRASMGGTPLSAASGGSTPASVGMQLAEQMHQVAEQLQVPAAPAGLAALATPGAARLAAAAGTPATGRFQFAADVEAMIQALDARTPATALGQQPALGRSAAGATTVRRAGGARLPRLSFAAGPATLLDLDSYDANGERSTQEGPTPLLRHHLLGLTPPAAAAAGTSGGPRGAGAAGAAVTPAEVRALREEVASLRLQLSESNAQREEVVGLLGGYQSSIRELQDQHSAMVVRLQGEAAALKAERDDLRRAHAGVDSQFRTLYGDKYVPLKAEAAGLRDEVAALQKRVVAEELRAHKAAREAAATRQDLAAAVERAERYKAGMLEQQGEAAAAREAEQRLQQQLAGEQRRTEKAVAAKEAELGELRARYEGVTKQYDEAVHRINLAKQARERAQSEVQRKEEEVVALEVRLKEYEGALREYKRENGKFFEMKERYKTTIAGLEKDVQAKEKDKQQLLEMCNELVTRLEREGLSV